MPAAGGKPCRRFQTVWATAPAPRYHPRETHLSCCGQDGFGDGVLRQRMLQTVDLAVKGQILGILDEHENIMTGSRSLTGTHRCSSQPGLPLSHSGFRQ